MAQAGSATTAYKLWLSWDDDGGHLHTQQATRLRTDCAAVDHAAKALVEDGATVVVAGSDMQQLRGRLAAFGVLP